MNDDNIDTGTGSPIKYNYYYVKSLKETKLICNLIEAKRIVLMKFKYDFN